MDFSQVEAKFKSLKAQFEAGALTEAEFKAQLEELMVQDEEGKWWMIGYETGEWYYHDGEKWVQSEPPPVTERRREQVAAQVRAEAARRPEVRGEPKALPPARVERRWIWVIVGVIITILSLDMCSILLANY